MFEKRDEGAIDVAGHDSVHGANELASNEDDREDRGGSQEREQGSLEVFATRVLVQLVHRWVDTHAAKEPLNGVAHAAGAHAEYHHRILRR